MELHPIVLWTLFVALTSVDAKGAGRAFPIPSENYIIESFQEVNRNIEWDPTNYLVDRSGHYCNCKQIHQDIEDLNDYDGQTFAVAHDYIEGHGVDTESVNRYLHQLIDRWRRSRKLDETIKKAERFGCSVRPGCEGIVAVACLFGNNRYGLPWYRTASPTQRPNRRTRRPPPPGPFVQPTRAPTPRWTPYPTRRPTPYPTPRPPQWEIPEDNRGLAFTPYEYKIAEKITGRAWDRSHYLENLSGYEINCNMVHKRNWSFDKSIRMASDIHYIVKGVESEAQNTRGTEAAITKILQGMKELHEIGASDEVGCSVIPDCIMGHRGEVWTVVSCIYGYSMYLL